MAFRGNLAAFWDKRSWDEICGGITAVVVGGVVIGGTYYVSRAALNDFALSMVVLALAVALGWLFGLLVSPYRENKEDERFSEYAKAVSAGFGGFVLGKADTLFRMLTADFNQLAAIRTFGALAVFVTAVLVVYYFRSYGGGSRAATAARACNDEAAN